MGKRFDEFYKVKRLDNLGDPEFWNKRLQDVDLRLAAREIDGERIADAVDQLTSVALARLNDTFTPVLNEAIERLASVGALFSASSQSENTIGAGNKIFLLDAQTRAGFVVPEYVVIRPAEHSDRGDIAQVIDYDRNTGLLDVTAILSVGSGTYDQWLLRITGAPDVDHATRTDNPHLTTAGQVGAYTKDQVDSAIQIETDARTAAAATAVIARNTSISSAVAFEAATRRDADEAESTARNSAISSAITVIKGGVASTYDTLAKLADAVTTNATAIGKRLRFDVAQTLSAVDKTQLLSNIGTIPVAAGGTGATDAASARDALGAQAALGFTPIQQGGGLGHGANKIFLGWSGFLRATVDATDIGQIWAANAVYFGNGVTGCLRLPNGVMLQWGQFIGTDTDNNFFLTFPNYCFTVNAQMRGSLSGEESLSVAVDNVGTASFSTRTRYVNNGGQVGSASQGGTYFAIGW